ncbi:MAG: hypothetical protein Q9225_007975 [Loekoesia sp. 1 TL-2023]
MDSYWETLGLSVGSPDSFHGISTAQGKKNRLAKPVARIVQTMDAETSERSTLPLPCTNFAESMGNTLEKPMTTVATADLQKEETKPIIEAVITAVTKPREPTSPFPFMKLPPELRMMVYKFHFFQKPDHIGESRCWDSKFCGLGKPCRTARVNDDIPIQRLWMASKTIYYEAMPLFFSTRIFDFETTERLGQFLVTIGSYHRQHITAIAFTYEKAASTHVFEVHEAFRLLGDCPNLAKLFIHINSHHIWKKHAMSGFKSLLKIRGIKELEIGFFDAYWITYLYGLDLDAAKKKVTDKLEVLKNSHTAADMKRREAKGITKHAEPRMTFIGSKPESRADRIARREQLKEIA